MKKLEKRKNVLKEAGVLLVVAIFVLTSIVIVPTMAQPVPVTIEQPAHDVGIESIDEPQDGCAAATMPMQVTVKNYGTNSEVTDVQMEVLKCESEVVLIDEDFSGAFPPTGWTTDYWLQSATNNAGGGPPEARVYKYDQYYGGQYYNNYIMSKSVDTGSCCKIILKFNFSADIYSSYLCNFYVNWTNDSGVTWHDVTPWINPIPADFTGSYTISINCSCSGCGDNFQVKWEYVGYYYDYDYFYLDDVKVVRTCCVTEYAELVEDVTVPVTGQVVVDFPDWTPNAWGDPAYECSNVFYCIRAFTLLEDDNSSNDCKTKYITLHFDTIPPVTTIQSFNPAAPTGNNGWYKGPPSPTVTVTLDATDNCEVVKTSYTLDGGISWTDYTGPWPFSFTVSGCVHAGDFQYYSVDVCGNVEGTVTDPNLKVDTILPGKWFFSWWFIHFGFAWDFCSGLDRVDWICGTPPTTVPWPPSTGLAGTFDTFGRLGIPPATPVNVEVYDLAGNWI